VVWVRPNDPSAPASIIGSWNNWKSPGIPLVRAGDSGYFGARIPAGAGELGYLVVEASVPHLDKDNPLTTFRGDTEVSLLEVPACGSAHLVVTRATATDEGAVTIEAELRDARSGQARPVSEASVRPAESQTAVDSGGAHLVAQAAASGERAQITATGAGFPRGRHSFVLSATDDTGKQVDQRVSVWVGARAPSWDDALVYQIMIDRFRGDEGAYLQPPAGAGDRAGGTLRGVQAALEDGTLDALGVSALWLSPVYQNPVEPQTDRFGNVVTGYHGYWPIDDAAVEPRLGGEAALAGVIRTAHAKGIRVLLDVVPNHVFETHPIYQQHRTDGWFHQSPSCVCGSEVCPWSTHIQDCWFTPYLPDFRFENAETSAHASAAVVAWLTSWDLDGVRIDAVPMMNRSLTRRINRDVRRAVGDREAALLLGEVFTGPGAGGIEAIRPFLGPHTLDSAFDFPGMWALREGFGTGAALTGIESILAMEDARYEGSGVLSARIIGNHDVSRFLSDAAGNGGNDPWTSPPPQPTTSLPYLRHRLALAFLLTMPGLPILYSGDEVALAGAGDPDCRRPLPAPSALLAEQQETLALATRLGSLRACSAALRSPSREPLLVSADVLVYARRGADGSSAVVIFPARDGQVALHEAGTYRDVSTGEAFTLPATVSVTAGHPRVLLPADDPCLASTPVRLSWRPMEPTALAEPTPADETPRAALTARLRALRDALGEGLVEREIPLRLALLASLAGEHLLLLGPPGTAKSLLARRLRLAFRGAALFERLLTRFSVPEELFGPLSLRALEEDRYERSTTGFLPTAHVAFLDEIFKANSAILNALLTLLNEREFDNGARREKTPLIAVIGASNELPEGPELAALFDRFLLRCHVGPISDDAFDRLLDLPSETTVLLDERLPFDEQELRALRQAAAAVRLGPEARQLLRDARVFHRERGATLSDRRFRKIVGLLQMAAYTMGRDEVSVWDCALLSAMSWDDPSDEEQVRAFYATRLGLLGSEGTELPRLLGALEARLADDRESLAQARDAEGKLLYGTAEAPSRSPTARVQRTSRTGAPLYLLPIGWGDAKDDRTNEGQGYTEDELDFEHRKKSFRKWEERTSYLADSTNFFVETKDLPPLLEPARFSVGHLAAATRDAEELRLALARHRDGLARTLSLVPREVDTHLWLDPDTGKLARARLEARLVEVDAALLRCQTVVDGIAALPSLAPQRPGMAGDGRG
jgi:glycosidase/MoxR-like ATPase